MSTAAMQAPDGLDRGLPGPDPRRYRTV
jgi:UDP-2,3-diacylglucosamine pyrophosphatase LpxH